MSETTIPVTVLTGYLGAGKTTLLNRILTENHGRKYAVVINEFGELGVDNDLVVDADEEVFEMNNGCICCTVRGDLIRIVGGLMKRRGKFDGIIIETTGLANPAPVAQTFFVDEGVRARTRLDAIVTVVDAKNLPARLIDSAEAEAQIAFADVIVLNKTDLVSEAELVAVEASIRKINRFRAHPPHATLGGGDCGRIGPGRLRPGAHIGGRAARVPDRGSRARARRRHQQHELRGGPADRPREVQCLDQPAAAGKKGRTCCGPRGSCTIRAMTGGSRSRRCT